jgi:RsiW-degrading membrane proteinase PrsW (M82 family)
MDPHPSSGREFPGRAFSGGIKKRDGAPFEPRLSIVFPMARHWRELGAKVKWGRFAGVMAAGFLLTFVSRPASHANAGMIALGFAIVVGTCEIFYRLCGRPIPPGVRVGYLAFATVYTLILLPVTAVAEEALIVSGVNSALSAGLLEELVKFGMVLLVYGAGRELATSKGAQVRSVGIHEPLEGILVGIISGAVFAYVEGMLYVPIEGANAVVSRTLISPGLHAACAGLMGYFFGLSFLMPTHKWRLRAMGYAIAAGTHTLWDLAGATGAGLPVQMLFAGFNYALLGAAILKARKISPTRSTNFATEILQPVHRARADATPPPPNPEPPAAPIPTRTAQPALRLRDRTILLNPGLELLASEIPGLQGAGVEGVIATVERQSPASDLLGLCNRSAQTWTVTSQKGTRPLAPGQAIKVRQGVIIDFGCATGEFTV